MPKRFTSSPRDLRRAWLIDRLCQMEGYAFPTDAYIGKLLDMQVNNVQAALNSLEKAGAIVRASVFVRGKPQRRIWPSFKILPLAASGMDTPHEESTDTPHRKGRDSIRTTQSGKQRNISSTAMAARGDAERRARTRPTDDGFNDCFSLYDALDTRGAPKRGAATHRLDLVHEEGVISDRGVAGAPPINRRASSAPPS